MNCQLLPPGLISETLRARWLADAVHHSFDGRDFVSRFPSASHFFWPPALDSFVKRDVNEVIGHVRRYCGNRQPVARDRIPA